VILPLLGDSNVVRKFEGQLCQICGRKKLPLTAYRKSYMRNRLVPRWMTLTFV